MTTNQPKKECCEKCRCNNEGKDNRCHANYDCPCHKSAENKGRHWCDEGCLKTHTAENNYDKIKKATDEVARKAWEYPFTDTAEKPFEVNEAMAALHDEIEGTDTSDWQERFKQWEKQLRSFPNIGNFMADGFKSFIEKELERARKEGEAYGAANYRAHYYEHAHNEGFEAGRLATLEEVRGEIERLKPILWDEDALKHTRNIAYYEALLHIQVFLDTHQREITK